MAGIKMEDQAVTPKAPAKNTAVKKAPVKMRASFSQKATANKKYTEKNEEESDEDIKVDENENVEVIEVEKTPIFTNFKADEKLDEGLCIIRSLGDGTYELVNLSNAPRADISTKATREVIKAIPGRREMLAISVEQWEDARLKADLAIKSADGKIFRFLKLPIELRYKIYEEVLIAAKPLHTKEKWTKAYYGLGLLLTCRQMYQESLTFLYRNTFSINRLGTASLPKYSTVWQSRVQYLNFWWVGYAKDGAAFRWMAKLPKLKTLQLSYCNFDVNKRLPHQNKLYQNDAEVSWGPSRTNGFDSLVKLRGLEKVTVTVSKGVGTKDEKQVFETFLMGILTLPKVVPQPKAVKPKKSPKVAAAAKRS